MSGTPSLKKEVAEKYELTEGTPIIGGFLGFGPLDLSLLNLEGADNLFASGFPGLKLKEPKPNKKNSAE